MGRKGTYLGGGTVIRSRSDWFSEPNQRTEKVHSQGLREGDAARERLVNRELARKKEALKALDKQSKDLKKQERKAQERKAELIAAGKSSTPPEPGTKAAEYRAKQEQKISRVQVVRKASRKVPDQ